MKTLKYIMKTSLQKIFNVKFITFCIAFLILSWTYDQPEFYQEKDIPFPGVFFLLICHHGGFCLFFILA